ncbi:hypothetical protein ABLO18_16110 [Mycobacterium tuberculosis]
MSIGGMSMGMDWLNEIAGNSDGVDGLLQQQGPKSAQRCRSKGYGDLYLDRDCGIGKFILGTRRGELSLRLR